MPEPANLAEVAPPILTRLQLAEQIELRLAGTITDVQLAKWAFDRFYKLELETVQLEEADSEVISEILDELMFADDPSFQLDDANLATLLARLHV